MPALDRVVIRGNQRLRHVRRVRVDLGADDYAVVTVEVLADIEVPLDLKALSIADPTISSAIDKGVAAAASDIAGAAARRNYVEVNGEDIRVDDA